VAFADGSLDVVIGTHRLLSKGISFDLGLVVIDEEQRFALNTKETLKQLKTNVDVLSMSATPIPRTLIRDRQGVRRCRPSPPRRRTPPGTRLWPVFRRRSTVAAIERELLREGQVFYVHNRVSTIPGSPRNSQRLPDARIAVATGKCQRQVWKKSWSTLGTPL